MDLAPYFADVDGDARSFRAASSDPEVLTLKVAEGVLKLTPVVYGSAHARRDGGNGVTGNAVELEAGFRATHGIVHLEAQGLALAWHSTNGYRERGIGMTLSLGQQQQGSRCRLVGATTPAAAHFGETTSTAGTRGTPTAGRGLWTCVASKCGDCGVAACYRGLSATPSRPMDAVS